MSISGIISPTNTQANQDINFPIPGPGEKITSLDKHLTTMDWPGDSYARVELHKDDVTGKYSLQFFEDDGLIVFKNPNTSPSHIIVAGSLPHTSVLDGYKVEFERVGSGVRVNFNPVKYD